jgi:AcrR family transcriptional regulator
MRSSMDAAGGMAVAGPNGLNKKQLSRERSVETILRTALKVMVKRGYRNTTIEQIADASGFTKGAVYHYFDSKEELLMAVLDMVEQDVVTAEAPKRAEVASASDQVVRFLHAQGARALERADSFLFLVTLAGDFSNLGEAVGRKVDAIFDRLGEAFQQIVLAGQESGEFARQVSAVDLARLYVSSFSGNVLLWHRSGRREDIGRSQVRALRIVMLSVLNRSAISGSPSP